MATGELGVGTAEVAAHLQVTKESVYRWVDTKGLPAHRVERLLRFRLSQTDEWVQNYGVGSDPAPSKLDSNVRDDSENG